MPKKPLIDLGFPKFFQERKNIQESIKRPVRQPPTYSGQKFAVFMNRNGVISKRTFRNSTRARDFQRKAEASGSFDVVSDVVLDF